MSIDPEPALAALFAKLQSTVTVNFTADADGTTAVLTNASSVAGLFTGLPVFGPGAVRGATVESFTASPNTITLSQNTTKAATGGAFKTGFLTTGRRVIPWTQVQAQPAMFMRHTASEDHWNGQGLPIRTVEVEIWLYSKAGQNPDAVPDTVLNNLVTAVYSAFAPDDEDGRYTLGGLAYWCRIDGRSEYDPGDIDAQSKALIPVKITLP